MAVMDDICDDLAMKALDLEEKTGDEDSIKKIAASLGNSSPTMEETFLTAIRIRRAERRARSLLAEMEVAADAPKPAAEPEPAEEPATPPDTTA